MGQQKAQVQYRQTRKTRAIVARATLARLVWKVSAMQANSKALSATADKNCEIKRV